MLLVFPCGGAAVTGEIVYAIGYVVLLFGYGCGVAWVSKGWSRWEVSAVATAGAWALWGLQAVMASGVHWQALWAAVRAAVGLS